MKTHLAIFACGAVTGALIGHIEPTVACLIGVIVGIGVGYFGSLLHLIFSQSILEKEIGGADD